MKSSKFKNILQILTAIFSVIYLIFIIMQIADIADNGEVTNINLFYFAFFIVFIAGALFCVDYPFITGIIFSVWFILIWLFESKFLTYEELSWGAETGLLFGFPVLLVGLLFILNWWINRSKWS